MNGTYSRLAQSNQDDEKSDNDSQSIEVYTPEHDTSSERAKKRTEDRSDFHTSKLPVKRQTKRYSFEFYVDQLTRIKQLKYEAEMNGQKLSQSDIVRQALDEYLERL